MSIGTGIYIGVMQLKMSCQYLCNLNHAQGHLEPLRILF